MNRTDIALDQIHTLAESVMVMESYFLLLSSSVEKTFMEVRQAQKAAVLYQTLLPMVLEEEMGRVIYLQDLLTPTQAFRKGVQYLLHGQLAMDLVPPEALTQAIREVNGYLKANYPRFEAAFHGPAFYYDKSKPMFTFKNEELIVYVRIPVVSGDHLFRVYEVLSFPVTINMGNHAKKDALQIVNLPAHVVVSLTKQYYIPLVNVNWAGCYGQTIVMCKDLPYMKKVRNRTCIASLLRKDRTVIIKLCLLDYLLNPDFGEMAIYLEGGEVLVVSAEKEGQLICGNLPPVPKTIKNYAKIRIGCDCAFQTKGGWIPYSLRACDQWAGEYEVSYPENELLEARLNVPTWRENMTGLLPREAPIMVAADPIPTDMRTDIQRVAQGFASRVPLTDLMHKIDRHRKEKKQTIRKIIQEYREDSSFEFEWGNFSGGFGIFSMFLIILGLDIIGVVAWKC